MHYHSRVPAPPLDLSVESIWVYRSEPRPRALERVLPTGAAQLIINLHEDETRLYDPADPQRWTVSPGTVLAGPRTSHQVIDTCEQEHVAGVAFRPGGFRTFVRVPAHEASEADVALEALWGRRRTAVLRERLLEAAAPEQQLDVLEDTLAEMWTAEGVHPAVRTALARFDRVPTVASVAAVTEAVGLSPKRFIERFRIDVGVTPKRFCRIRRFQRAVALASRGHQVEWTRIAADCGYFDQAHFIHDFRSFAGLTPTAYDAARTPFPNHVKFLQSARGGS